MLFGQRFALRWCTVATQVKPGPALATDAEARLAVLKKEIAEATAAMEAAKELDRFEEARAMQHKVRAPPECETVTLCSQLVFTCRAAALCSQQGRPHVHSEAPPPPQNLSPYM